MKRFVFFSIFNAKYFFNKSTATQSFRNPVKYNWSSTRKTKKKIFLGFILRDITPWNHKKSEKLLFSWVLWGPGNQCGIQWFFMILWISENFSLYLLVKNSFNLKLGFFTYFEYISGGVIRHFTFRYIHKLHINKFFSQCLIVNSLLL